MRDKKDGKKQQNRKVAELRGLRTKSGIKAGGLEYDFTNGSTNGGGILPPNQDN